MEDEIGRADVPELDEGATAPPWLDVAWVPAVVASDVGGATMVELEVAAPPAAEVAPAPELEAPAMLEEAPP